MPATEGGPAGAAPTTAVTSVTAALSGETGGSVGAEPSAVAFNPTKAGKTATRRVILKGDNSPDALRDLRIDTRSPWVSAKVVAMDAEARITGKADASVSRWAIVEVILSPRAPAGAHDTEITVTNRAGERLVIPVVVFVEM